jgi:hypothetical protein
MGGKASGALAGGIDDPLRLDVEFDQQTTASACPHPVRIEFSARGPVFGLLSVRTLRRSCIKDDDAVAAGAAAV